jgi:hypothetical protein
MKRNLLLIFCALPLFTLANTQPDSSRKATADKAIHSGTITDGYTNQFSFQVEAGTQGLGADLRYGLSRRFSLRLGGNYIPVTYNSNISVSGFHTDYAASANFLNIHLLGDIVPFKGARGLRIVTGAAYLYKANTGLLLSPTGDYSFGNYNVNGTDIGTLNMDVSWKGVAPYLGLGLFKSFPSHVFNFNLDLGTYYLSAPSTHIVGTSLLVENNQLEPQFNNNLKDYRWLPVLQLNFNFKLK